MSTKRSVLILLSFVFLYGCTDPQKDTLVKNSDYIVQKKPVEPIDIGVIEQSISNLDYSNPNPNNNLPLPAIQKTAKAKKELPDGYSYALSRDTLPWKVELHNKPLSDIKGRYVNGSESTPKILTDIVTYSSYELLTLNSAFPETLIVKKAYINSSSNSIHIEKNDIELTKSNINDELKNLSFTLMNINCSSNSESKDTSAKLKINELLNIQSTLSDVPTLIKIRYKTAPQFKQPLAIVTLVFDNIELSVNRSAVYSGLCALDTQYNQDQLLSSIQDYAKENNKGQWSTN